MFGSVNRVQPAAPPAAYLSWRVLVPRATHWRAATCEEYGCRWWAEGWATVLPVGHDQIDWIRHHSGLRYTQSIDGGLVRFEFAAGQQCFAAARHVVPLERPPILRRDVGDWRSRTPGTAYDRADQWIDDMQTHLDKLPH